MKGPITKDMKISDVISNYPETISVLIGAGIGCIGCPAAQSETIEEGLKSHGLSSEQIDRVVSAMNDAVNKTKK